MFQVEIDESYFGGKRKGKRGRGASGCDERYRCSKHNITVGGASRSRHLIGCAADIACSPGVPFEKFHAAAARIFVPAGGGCLEYRHRVFLHLEVSRSMIRCLWYGGPVDIPPRLSL